jgi:ubiquinone/menaquinone biosynthesis C-methylase UbiE
MDASLRERIHEANIEVHRFEAEHYELLHPEVYCKEEQQRTNSTLKMADYLIESNQRRALDFGAGTGNLTGKLLHMGYSVTAVDISPEMCAILKKRYAAYLKARRLTIINSPLEDVRFERDDFDLIACYSVLHHLPDYKSVLWRLTDFLKKGGVMYIDHEASPFYWLKEAKLQQVIQKPYDLLKFIYFHSNTILNALYFQIIGFKVPSLDYTLSDYWHKKERPFDHHLIKCVFQKGGFEFFKRTDYYLKSSWIPNPLFYLYKYLCKPEMSYWMAKK